jgi:hypothetical protein
MVISFNYKQVLKYIVFPVHVVPREDMYIEDGLLMLDNLVIDDRNQLGDTLGKRRLQTPHKLKQLNKTYQEFLDLIVENPPILIDSSGGVFHYEKTEYQPLKSHKIKKKELQGTHTRIWLHGVNFAFLVSTPPIGKSWAQVLYLNKRPWLIYSFSEDRKKDIKKKI